MGRIDFLRLPIYVRTSPRKRKRLPSQNTVAAWSHSPHGMSRERERKKEANKDNYRKKMVRKSRAEEPKCLTSTIFRGFEAVCKFALTLLRMPSGCQRKDENSTLKRGQQYEHVHTHLHSSTHISGYFVRMRNALACKRHLCLPL